MRFLICGIGSIGQRHYKNLIALGHQVALYRERNSNTPFIEKFFALEKKNGRIPLVYKDLATAMREFNPDAVFVTNPNSMHAELATKIAGFGKHIFIEKPVAHESSAVQALKKYEQSKKIIIMVGYNVRYHPL